MNLGKVVPVLAALIIMFGLSATALAYHGNSNGHQNNHGHHSSGSTGRGSGSGSSGSGSGGNNPPPVTPPPVVPPPVTPPPTSGEIILTNVYTTGYANADNTPAGSNQTNLGGHSGTTGGTGTYANPTTVAVGGSIINGQEIDDFPYGTIFYVPNVRKYFVASDLCGDTNTPQNQPCHSLAQAPAGATLWLDLWVSGGSSNQDNCESDITGLHTVIENPPSNLAVVSGGICSTSGVPQTQYGDTIVTQ